METQKSCGSLRQLQAKEGSVGHCIEESTWRWKASPF